MRKKILRCKYCNVKLTLKNKFQSYGICYDCRKKYDIERKQKQFKKNPCDFDCFECVYDDCVREDSEL